MFRTVKQYFAHVLLGILLLSLVLPALSSVSALASGNYIANPSAETSDATGLPTGWLQGNWGANTASFSYVAAAQDGAKALRVDMSGYSNGDAKWYFTPVTVTPGATYDFSDYYQSSVATTVTVQYQTTSGTYSYIDIATAPVSAAAWTQVKASFTVPANVNKLSVFHLINTNGNLTIDNASLTDAAVVTPSPTATPVPTVTPVPTNTPIPTSTPVPTATPVPTSTPTPAPTPTPTPTQPVFQPGNLVPNPDVEQAGVTTAAPNSWSTAGWGTNTSAYSYLNTGHSASHSLQVTVSGYANGDAKWMHAAQPITAGRIYNFSVWYKSTGAASVTAMITNSDGSVVFRDLGPVTLSSTWKQYKGQFTAPAGAQSASVFVALAANGTLTTDDYALAADATTVTNGVPNASLETASYTNAKSPSGWTKGGWGTNTTTYSYLSTGHTGTRSVKVNTTAFTNGDAVWTYAPQAVVGGGRYRVSDWYMSNITSEVELQMVMADGTIQYLTIGHPGKATSWAQFSTIVNLPVGVTAVSVLHLIAGVGYLTIDDMSVVQSNVVPFSRPLVSVTFDDGWASQVTNGLPLMQRYGIAGTYYLISGYVNAPEYITTAQGLALKAAGEELGSHTVDHPDLTTLGATKITSELSGSQKVLQQLFGVSITNFASPYGTYNQQTQTIAKQYYKSYRSTDAGYNTKDNFNPYNLLVQNVDINTAQSQVDAWLAEAKREGAWLILVYHEVDPTIDPVNHLYNTTPAQLEANLQAIKASGITPVTIAQGLAEVSAQ